MGAATALSADDAGGHDGPGEGGVRRDRRHLRLVGSEQRNASPRVRRGAAYDRSRDEAGTTTAEYTVVTGAAVAFGALLFKVLTSSWGDKILSTAFEHVISLLGF